MKRSDERILTSHAGSLPRPDDLIELNRARQSGESTDEAAYQERLRAAVGDVVRRQKATGIDVVPVNCLPLSAYPAVFRDRAQNARSWRRARCFEHRLL